MEKCKWCNKWVWPWQKNSLVGKLCGYAAHVGCSVKTLGVTDGR